MRPLYATVFAFLIVITGTAQCLIAHYPLDANANDVSGNNYHGTVHDVLKTEDRYGFLESAFNFNGITSYVELNNNAPIITTTEFTISAWARLVSSPGGNDNQGVIFQQRSDAAAPATATSTIVLMGDDLNQMSRMMVRSSVNQNGVKVSASAPRPAWGSWHHYVGTLGSDDTVRLYIDGVEVAKTHYDQTGDFTTDIDHVTIGSHFHTGNAFEGMFNGDIDDVKIYNCGLTPADILNLYTSSEYYHARTVEFSLFPNPANESVAVQIAGVKEFPVELTVTNLLGETVRRENITQDGTITIERHALPAGVYSVQLMNGDHLIKQHQLVFTN